MYALFFLPLVPTLGLFFAGRPFEAGVFLSTAEVFLCCGEDLLPLLFILFLWCFGMAARVVRSCRKGTSEQQLIINPCLREEDVMLFHCGHTHTYNPTRQQAEESSPFG